MARDMAAPAPAMAMAEAPREEMQKLDASKVESEEDKAAAEQPSAPLRTDFSETAFWQPQLLSGQDGSVDFIGDDDAGHRWVPVGGRCDGRRGLHVANPQQLY